MRRPWQLWALYLLTLAVVFPAMGWLTLTTLELDRSAARLRHQAEVEEAIGNALWRMDANLTLLLAQEAARPYYVYRPSYLQTQSAAKGKGAKGKGPKGGAAALVQKPSPLIVQSSEYVLLHFELDEEGRLTSPQAPEDAVAMGKGAAESPPKKGAVQEDTSNIAISKKRLAQLQQLLKYERLAASLPKQNLPQIALAPDNYFGNSGSDAPQGQIIVGNSIDFLPQNTPAQQQAANSLGQQSSQPANAPALQTNQQAINASPQFAAQSQSVQSSMQSPFQQSESVQRRGGSSTDAGRNQRLQTRLGKDFFNRGKALQEAALQQRIFYQSNDALRLSEETGEGDIQEGVSRPFWVGTELLFARRVEIGGRRFVQGCWLDWPKIQSHLAEMTADIFTEVRFEPLTDATDMRTVRLSRTLATIPVQLVPSEDFSAAPFSLLRVSLMVSWLFMLIATAASAILLQGVIALSERRSAFVSAVTHELRTPLTTFRMYAEMLTEGMVADEKQRSEYLHTLRIEADRLWRLVENVLSYARLERGKRGGRREAISVASLLERVETRLCERTAQAKMELKIEADDAAREAFLWTDPDAVEQILFNLIDNACKYAAAAEDRRIHLQIDSRGSEVRLRVRDHGPGVAADAAGKLFKPFSRSARDIAAATSGVGLGLALCQRLARELGGQLAWERENKKGASFFLALPKSDRDK